MEKVRKKEPHIICSLVYITGKENVEIELLSKMRDENIDISIFDDNYEITISKIDSYEWYLENILDQLFQDFDKKRIVDYIDINICKVLLDIEIWRTDRYPSIIFSGKNMEKIRTLKADISIDMYG